MKKAMTVFLAVMGIFFIANIVQAKQRRFNFGSALFSFLNYSD